MGDLVCGLHNYRYTRTLEKSRSGGYLFGKKKRTLEMAAAEDAIVVNDAHESIISREQSITVATRSGDTSNPQ